MDEKWNCKDESGASERLRGLEAMVYRTLVVPSGKIIILVPQMGGEKIYNRLGMEKGE